MSDAFYNSLFQLKLTAKLLERNSKKAELASTKKKKLVAKCLLNGEKEAAEIHAQDAVRKHNESIHLLQLYGKVTAIHCKVSLLHANAQVNKIVVKSMEKLNALEDMDMEKVVEMLNRFEVASENVDVLSGLVTSTIDKTTATTAPTHEVEALLQEMMDENALQLNATLVSPASKMHNSQTQTTLPVKSTPTLYNNVH